MIKFTIQEFAIKQVQTQMTPEKEQDLSLREVILDTDSGRLCDKKKKKNKNKNK